MPMRFTPRRAASAVFPHPGRTPLPTAADSARPPFLRRRPLVRVRRAPRLLPLLVLLAIVIAGALALLLATAPPARAQPQPPLGSEVFAFPGAFSEPKSGASAGRALADRWLGADVFDNPSAPAGRWHLEASPVLLHSSRQDLRADNTDFDETSAFVDLGSAAVGGPLWTIGGTRLDGWAYAQRTVARSEENAFLLGRNTDPLSPSATIASETSVRETAIGGALAAGSDGFRAGVAGEWVMRDDDYRFESESGAPSSGERHTQFDGAAPAVRVGVRWQSGQDGPGQLVLGAAARWTGALELEGTEKYDLLTGAGENPVGGEREAAWEGGFSLAWRAGEVFRLFGGAGGSTERAWEGFGVAEGSAFEWSAAAEYREPGTPLSLRIGFGTESSDGAGAADATRLGIGGSWTAGDGTLELGLLHRSVSRDGSPDSYEDRVVATVRWAL